MADSDDIPMAAPLYEDGLPGPWDDMKYVPGRELKRLLLRLLLGAVVGVCVLYEYAATYPAERSPTLDTAVPPPQQPKDRQGRRQAAAEAEPDPLDFASAFLKAKEEHSPEFSVSDVRKDFKAKYAGNAKPLLCSACKLTAATIGKELIDRNASGQQEPVHLLDVMKQASESACESLPKPLLPVDGDRRQPAHFAHFEGEKLSGIESRRADVAWRSARKVCIAVLGETRWSMLETLIRRKVPHETTTGRKGRGRVGEAGNDNWERWLCARHARVCKRSEVQEDDEEENDDDEEGEL